MVNHGHPSLAAVVRSLKSETQRAAERQGGNRLRCRTTAPASITLTITCILRPYVSGTPWKAGEVMQNPSDRSALMHNI